MFVENFLRHIKYVELCSSNTAIPAFENAAALQCLSVCTVKTRARKTRARPFCTQKRGARVLFSLCACVRCVRVRRVFFVLCHLLLSSAVPHVQMRTVALCSQHFVYFTFKCVYQTHKFDSVCVCARRKKPETNALCVNRNP